MRHSIGFLYEAHSGAFVKLAMLAVQLESGKVQSLPYMYQSRVCHNPEEPGKVLRIARTATRDFSIDGVNGDHVLPCAVHVCSVVVPNKC